MTGIHKKRSWLSRIVFTCKSKILEIKFLIRQQPYQELDRSVLEVRRLQSEASQRIRAICLLAKSVNISKDNNF